MSLSKLVLAAAAAITVSGAALAADAGSTFALSSEARNAFATAAFSKNADTSAANTFTTAFSTLKGLNANTVAANGQSTFATLKAPAGGMNFSAKSESFSMKGSSAFSTSAFSGANSLTISVETATPAANGVEAFLNKAGN